MFLVITFEDRYGEYGSGNVEIRIDLPTKKVMDIEELNHFEGSFFPKVTDTGFYRILDNDYNEIFYILEEYVPDIIPNDCGDYIDFEIENGFVINFTATEEEVIEYFKENGRRSY